MHYAEFIYIKLYECAFVRVNPEDLNSVGQRYVVANQVFLGEESV